jgi:hypothetical protein
VPWGFFNEEYNKFEKQTTNSFNMLLIVFVVCFSDSLYFHSTNPANPENPDSNNKVRRTHPTIAKWFLSHTLLLT